jgi:hypothetical protein
VGGSCRAAAGPARLPGKVNPRSSLCPRHGRIDNAFTLSQGLLSGSQDEIEWQQEVTKSFATQQRGDGGKYLFRIGKNLENLKDYIEVNVLNPSGYLFIAKPVEPVKRILVQMYKKRQGTFLVGAMALCAWVGWVKRGIGVSTTKSLYKLYGTKDWVSCLADVNTNQTRQLYYSNKAAVDKISRLEETQPEAPSETEDDSDDSNENEEPQRPKGKAARKEYLEKKQRQLKNEKRAKQRAAKKGNALFRHCVLFCMR